MNSVTLIGRVATQPVFHFTTAGRDLCRIRIFTDDTGTGRQEHHCLAWGPAAIILHRNLSIGDQLMVRGELHYRTIGKVKKATSLANILIRKFTFLGVTTERRATVGIVAVVRD